MKKCHECKCTLNDLYIKEIEINVGGPNEGCIEWADEYHVVPLCDKCYECYEKELDQIQYDDYARYEECE